MITVEIDRDGRTWYGRKLYKVRVTSTAGNLTCGTMTPGEFREWLRGLLIREISEGRPFQIIDNR